MAPRLDAGLAVSGGRSLAFVRGANKLGLVLACALVAACSGGGTGEAGTTPATATVTSPPPPLAPPPPPAPANAPPTIVGTPPKTVVAGQAYSFVPTGADLEGATLIYSVVNKPPWVSFNVATGALTGTPSTADIGTFANVVVSVSDGLSTASLAPFTITVQGGTLGTATLSWVAPTLRTDGSPLTDLAAYKVLVGTASGSYSRELEIRNPGLTTYVVENLAPGTYFFAVKAVDAQGVESEASMEVFKQIG